MVVKQASKPQYVRFTQLPAQTEVSHFAIMNPESNLHWMDLTEARNCIQSETHVWFTLKTQPHTTWVSHSPATTQHENLRRIVGCGDEHAEWPSCSIPWAKAAKRVIQYSRQQTHKHVKGIVLRQSWVTATACQWGKITDWMPVTTNPSLKAAFNSNVGKTRNRTTATTSICHPEPD